MSGSVRTFSAPTEIEAIRQAVEVFGKDALIVQIRRQPETKGLFRMAGRQRVELEACAPETQPAVRRPAGVQAHAREAARAYASGAPAAAAPAFDHVRLLEELSRKVDDLVRSNQNVAQSMRRGDLPEMPAALQEAYTALLEREVPEPQARRLAQGAYEALRGEELKNPVLVRGQIRQGLEKALRHAGPVTLTPGRCRVVALVGPTGVGKTTTIAKLATHFRHAQRRRVGLVTIDTYRMGAKEQLQQYADLLGLPMRVALTPGDLKRAVHEMSDRDLVLVDTAGHSQKELLKLNEVKAFLAAAGPHETHLVLSLGSHPRNLRHVLDVYKTLQVNRLLLTKLDEAVAFGGILDVAATSEMAFSYATSGQEVTERVGLAESARLARLVLGEESA